jgi:lipid-A-disaccharide synthase
LGWGWIFLVAGEESGDQLGGGVIEALRAEDPDVLIAGVGGRSMTTAGLTSLFPMTDLAVMGRNFYRTTARRLILRNQ